ncbi:MAG: CSLREA domain-containing protein [Actinomycetota bacterium]|nr:CSLREA domain-containing protein [Actinomycetota bacterium]
MPEPPQPGDDMRGIRVSIGLLGLLGAVLVPGTPANAATITVTTTADEFGTGPGCSLREAIRAAELNAAFGGCLPGAPGQDQIVVPAGDYRLDVEMDSLDESSGDLDVKSDVTITGAGPTLTTVDAMGLDRVMYIENALVTVEGMTLQGGMDTEGAGVFVNPSTVVFREVVLTGNEQFGMGFGGGMAIFNSDVTFERSTVHGNTGESGAGIYNIGSPLTLRDSTISGNLGQTPDGSGGGIYNAGGEVSLTNTTVSGNSVGRDGGGIHNDGGEVTIRNATITENTADDESDDDDAGDGGGIRNDGGTVTIGNSILADNSVRTAAVGEPDECSGPVSSLGFNVIGHDEGCAYTPGSGDQVGVFFPSLTGIDPKLGPLADNGGPTQTHMLLPGSPALDKGSTERAANEVACEPTDQRGVPRPQGGGCDVGAYELGSCLGVTINRVGTDGSDALTGTDANDGVLAKGGKDTVSALDGDDALCLGGGNDKASAGDGNDQVLGETGNDRLRGQGGNDVLKGQQGKDKINGGGGKDRLVGGPKKDTCSGGPGRDKGSSCFKERKIP